MLQLLVAGQEFRQVERRPNFLYPLARGAGASDVIQHVVQQIVDGMRCKRLDALVDDALDSSVRLTQQSFQCN